MIDKDEHNQIVEAGIDGEWRRLLKSHMESGSMAHLMAFLERRRRAGAVVYPPQKYLYAALRETPYEAVRVVIIGQDPYHGLGQAHGLCFSVQPQVGVPPSLRNIYRELTEDVGFHAPQHGCLSHWADQGVLLLNAVLSVEHGDPGSHRGCGWEGFTDDIIERLNEHSDRLVFMLWGSLAQKKAAQVNRQHHWVLEAPHPSPLSAYRGFFGSRHFSQCNRYLIDAGDAPIDWQLPDEPRAI
ncbi:MAG: uracil-DNA glycosylase [Cellvibrionales bacterium]|nr:uracil-DNA glycosylase [Porticoccaceae bacterium]|tara:strand:+ start:25820 stop:26542 length:723 start_codon:yes stop_codon:yes gene_type:complete